ncbi:Conserved_hypothetical protein [Hexamita inflata]|uniref:Uncharacterized protein n=1 Tax=Hexamita inflata TaxID=28002 RepID=A0AA86NF21_9EUKA|nr:Conserved hypothetical protein [Hexamita inflata]
MYNVECLFDHHPVDQVAIANFDISEININNPERPFTSLEMKQTSRNMAVGDLGFVEEDIDFGRATLVINYLMQMYPFFSYGVQYDQKLHWMRYKSQDVQQYQIDKYACELISLKQVGDYIASACHCLSSTKLSHWEIVKINVPELPTVKSAISVKFYHTLIDGASVMILFKKFNQLYSNLDLDLTIKPEVVQLSNFRSLMVYDEETHPRPPKDNHEHKLNLTKMTGTFKELNEYGSSLKHLEDYGVICRHYTEQQICRIPNVQYSFSLYAVQMAQFMGYAYFHGDIDIDQQYFGMAADIRRNLQFHYEGKIPNLDLTNRILGQAAVTSGLFSKGTTQTTLQNIAQQFQMQFENYKETSQKFWNTVISNETTDIYCRRCIPCSVVTSNLGKMDLDDGPIIQMAGYNTSVHNWDEAPCALACAFHRGKLGILVMEWDFKIFTEQQKENNNQVFLEINKQVKERGAENVTIQDVIEMYRTIWCQ